MTEFAGARTKVRRLSAHECGRTMLSGGTPASLWARRYSVASKSRSTPVGPQVICRSRWLRANLTRDADRIVPRFLAMLGLMPGTERQRDNTEIGTGEEHQDGRASVQAAT